MTEQTPKPGSLEAVEAGCSCPVLDNAHGGGWIGVGDTVYYWQSENCPLHTPIEPRLFRAE